MAESKDPKAPTPATAAPAETPETPQTRRERLGAQSPSAFLMTRSHFHVRRGTRQVFHPDGAPAKDQYNQNVYDPTVVVVPPDTPVDDTILTDEEVDEGVARGSIRGATADEMKQIQTRVSSRADGMKAR